MSRSYKKTKDYSFATIGMSDRDLDRREKLLDRQAQRTARKHREQERALMQNLRNAGSW